MGILRMGVPDKLINLLVKEHKIEKFVETGTYTGDTCGWASKVFKDVVTIEKSPIYYEKTKHKLRKAKNIQFLLGDTKEHLAEVVRVADKNIIFWLDAHWSGGDTAGKDDECPLLDELDIINNSDQDNVILIDDARLFLSPPPKPHDHRVWPNIVDVITKLNKPNKKIYIFEDVITCIPDFMESEILDYCDKR